MPDRNETPERTSEATRRARGLLAVALEVDKVMQPHHAKRGFAAGDLAVAWARIMGPDLAEHCAPRHLTRGPKGEAGTLHINVWGPLALELQHLSPQLIERINSHYGYRAVARLAFHQTPPPGLHTQPRRAKTAAAPGRRDRAQRGPDREARLAAIEDPELQAALRDLGESVAAATPE